MSDADFHSIGHQMILLFPFELFFTSKINFYLIHKLVAINGKWQKGDVKQIIEIRLQSKLRIIKFNLKNNDS